MPSAVEFQPGVLVWGGGSGGIAAALQAARAGAETLLLTPSAWLGGMVSAAGVCAPDGNELSPWQTGLWGALLRALAQEEPEGLDQNWVSCFGYRPASAERILRRWLAAEARLRWWPCCRLLSVRRDGSRIAAVEVEHDSERQLLRAGLRIAGSDRGDLLAWADAAFDLGWEARELTGEASAPSAEAMAQDQFFQRQPVQSPTWVVMGQLAATAAPDQPSRPLPAPFTQATERFGLRRTLTYGRLPGGLVMLNWPLHGNDWHQGLERAFSAAGEDQRALNDAMRAHSLAFATALQDASAGWLQPGAVFPSAAEAAAGALEGRESLALMPYWREGRRLVGLARVVEPDLLPLAEGPCRGPLPVDAAGHCSAVAVGNYANDHHYPGPDWPLAAKSVRWGGRWSGTPFVVPYGALVSASISNLLVADKCLSVSHIANGATRLQPLVLNIGQAAGQAAALCLSQNLEPAALPPPLLQEALICDPLAPAAPFPLWDTPWHHPQWRQRQLRLLRDPGALDQHAGLDDLTLDPHQAPPEPGERLWLGELDCLADGRYRLLGESGPDGEPWPLITLEPALNRWLAQQSQLSKVRLIGCANPWGPWLRVSRLAT
ncbi:MAG: FAD-dependent oxidoreductase [Synechococcaceae cyanobacterium]